jgi:hypothetical protein
VIYVKPDGYYGLMESPDEYVRLRNAEPLRVDIYRSETERTERRLKYTGPDHGCLTLTLSHNSDLHDYLLLTAGADLESVPEQILQKLGPIQMFERDVHVWSALYFIKNSVPPQGPDGDFDVLRSCGHVAIFGREGRGSFEVSRKAEARLAYGIRPDSTFWIDIFEKHYRGRRAEEGGNFSDGERT